MCLICLDWDWIEPFSKVNARYRTEDENELLYPDGGVGKGKKKKLWGSKRKGVVLWPEETEMKWFYNPEDNKKCNRTCPRWVTIMAEGSGGRAKEVTLLPKLNTRLDMIFFRRNTTMEEDIALWKSNSLVKEALTSTTMVPEEYVTISLFFQHTFTIISFSISLLFHSLFHYYITRSFTVFPIST